MLMTPNAWLAVRATPGKGRGVFATRDIPKGTHLFADPVVVLNDADEEAIDGTVIGRYVFVWDDEQVAVLFGWGSLINHGTPENVVFDSDYAEQTMVFRAARDIRAGEELVYDYGHAADELAEYYGIAEA